MNFLDKPEVAELAGRSGCDLLSIGSGADSISGGADADTITGGAGADIIDLGSDSAADVLKLAFTADSTTAAYDTVANFIKANDKIDLASTKIGSTGTTDGTFDVAATVAISGTTVNGITTGLFTFDKLAATSLADAITKVGTDVASVGKAVVFNYGGDAYFFADTDGASTTSADVLIKLTGVTAVSIAQATEVFTIS